MAPGSASWAQRNRVGDEVGAQRLVEDRVAPAAVLVEDLVDHVPLGDAPAIVADDGLDVELGLLVELVAVPALARDPARQLLVPQQRMTAHLLAVLLGELDEAVGVGEVELSPLGLEVLHLHHVLGRQGVEVLRERGLVCAVGLEAQAAPLHRSAERHLALRGRERVRQGALTPALRRRGPAERRESDAHAAAPARPAEPERSL